MFGQARAIHQTHCQIRIAAMFADLVNRHDVGVVESGDGFSFSAKAGQGDGGSQIASNDHLESHHAIERHLSSAINDSHTAAADLLQYLVIWERNAAVDFGEKRPAAEFARRRRLARQRQIEQTLWTLTK